MYTQFYHIQSYHNKIIDLIISAEIQQYLLTYI